MNQKLELEEEHNTLKIVNDKRTNLAVRDE